MVRNSKAEYIISCSACNGEKRFSPNVPPQNQTYFEREREREKEKEILAMDHAACQLTNQSDSEV